MKVFLLMEDNTTVLWHETSILGGYIQTMILDPPGSAYTLDCKSSWQSECRHGEFHLQKKNKEHQFILLYKETELVLVIVVSLNSQF